MNDPRIWYNLMNNTGSYKYCKMNRTCSYDIAWSHIYQLMLSKQVGSGTSKRYCSQKLLVLTRGGVLEDTFWSPWPRRSSPRPWPRGLKSSKIGLSSARGSSIFWIVKILWSAWKIFWKTFVEIAWKIFVNTFFFLESTCACVLGLEHSCPWPRECLSSERLSLASDFFCVLGLGLEPCVLDSTSGANT